MAELIIMIIKLIADLVPTITKWAREGVSDKEIQARLSDPAVVGQALLDRAEKRQAKGKALLGRPPKRKGS